MNHEVKVYEEGSLYFEKLLPKDWLLCDYDTEDSLLEFEFADGSRLWIPSEKICNVSIGQRMAYIFHPDQIEVQVPGMLVAGCYNTREVSITRFSCDERRKRQYLMIFFDFVENIDAKINFLLSVEMKSMPDNPGDKEPESGPEVVGKDDLPF